MFFTKAVIKQTIAYIKDRVLLFLTIYQISALAPKIAASASFNSLKSSFTLF